MTWYTQGADEHAEAEKQRKANSRGGEFNPREMYRFYMPQDSPPKIVMLLSDEPFSTHVHQFKHNNHWGNFLTCPKKTGVDSKCPLCDQDNYPRLIGHYTMLDVTGWNDKDGKHRMGLKILPASSDHVKKLEGKRKRIGSLVGALFEVNRYGKISIGDDWNYLERVSPDDYLRDHFDEIWKSLTYLPESWGFWNWKPGKEPGENTEVDDNYRKNNKSYQLTNLNFMDILEPLDYEGILEYLGGNTSKDDSFDFGANKTSTNDTMY